MNTMDSKMFSLRADEYEQEFQWINDIEFIKMIVPKVFGEKSFLDLCSGIGSIARYAYDLGWDVTAVDNNPQMLKKNDVNCWKILADVHQLPFEDNFFEVAVCRQGLQYTVLKDVLTEIKRVVRSKVYLAHITICDPIDISFWKSYYSIAAPERRNVFIPNQINTEACKVGFKHVYTNIVYTDESMLPPIRYLDIETQEKIVKILKNNDDKFNERNKITILDSDIKASRRWEISCFQTE